MNGGGTGTPPFRDNLDYLDRQITLLGTGGLLTMLTESGSGTLALTGTNAYGGSVTISAGTLRGTTDSIVGSVANSGTLEFDQPSTGTFSSNLSGAGVLIKTGWARSL